MIKPPLRLDRPERWPNSKPWRHGMATSPYRRASEFATGIGDTLDKIADKDVLLVGYNVSQRSIRGEPRSFVLLRLWTNDPNDYDGNPESASLYHAWSESLAEKLADIPENALPVLIRFTRVATSGGFRVWSFE
jgi:hypothetical protein